MEDRNPLFHGEVLEMCSNVPFHGKFSVGKQVGDSLCNDKVAEKTCCVEVSSTHKTSVEVTSTTADSIVTAADRLD